MSKIRCHIILLCSLLLATTALAQQRVRKAASDTTVFRGFSVHADIASPLMGIAVNKNVITAEAQFDVNLLNRFFPIAEIGYANAKLTNLQGATYHVSAPFWRIGLNYNVLKTKTDKGHEKLNKHYPFIGIRYGMSVLNYSLADVALTQDYWGETSSLSWQGKNAYAGWLELLAGVRVDVAKGFTMGWSVRIKLLLHSTLDNNETLRYVPGFGTSSGTQFTLNYTLGFTYRTKYERARMAQIEKKL